MSRKEEIQQVLDLMKELDIKKVGNLQLLELFEMWSYEVAEGYSFDRDDIDRNYAICRQEILCRMQFGNFKPTDFKFKRDPAGGKSISYIKDDNEER